MSGKRRGLPWAKAGGAPRCGAGLASGVKKPLFGGQCVFVR